MSKHKLNEDDFGELHIYAQGKLRGDKVKYKDSEICTIWYPVKDNDNIKDEEAGVCFTFPAKDTNDLIALLKEIKENKADIYIYNEEEEKKREEWERKQETLVEKIKDAFEDLGVHITPLYWRVSSLFVTRPMPSECTGIHVYKLCSGIHIGPILITWGRDWDDIFKKIKKSKFLKKRILASILATLVAVYGISNLLKK